MIFARLAANDEKILNQARFWGRPIILAFSGDTLGCLLVGRHFVIALLCVVVLVNFERPAGCWSLLISCLSFEVLKDFSFNGGYYVIMNVSMKVYYYSNYAEEG